MKILVPVKRVVDYNVKVRVKSEGTGVDIANDKMSKNPVSYTHLTLPTNDLWCK